MMKSLKCAEACGTGSGAIRERLLLKMMVVEVMVDVEVWEGGRVSIIFGGY